MAKNAAGDRLKHKIKVLQDDQTANGKLKNKPFDEKAENIKQDNIVKNSFNKAINSPNLVENVLSLTTGLATGYLTKKIAVGSKGNILRRLLGVSIQLGITTIVAQHPKAIKSSVLYILKYIRRKTN
jgi:hypothetical protein